MHIHIHIHMHIYGLPWWLSGIESTCQAGDEGSIPGQEDSLEKEMAAHSSILAWEIPWTEQPGRLQSGGSQRVGHDLTKQQQYLHNKRDMNKNN